MYGIISAAIGVLIAVMIMFNGAMSSALGNGMALVLIHGTGLLTVVLVICISRMQGKSHFPDQYKGFKGIKTIPWYLFSAGAVGIIIVVCNNVSFLNIGMSMTLALGLFGQSLTALIFDHFGLLGMEKIRFRRKKLIGLGMIFSGIIIMTVI